MKTKLLCMKCGLRVCTPCAPEAANDNHAVRLPNEEVLRSPETVNALARYCAEINISRRQFPNAMADTIYGFRGAILNHHDRPFIIGANDIDKAFGVPTDSDLEPYDQGMNWDTELRWISNFFLRATKPAQQSAQMKVTPRLRLIYIFVAIRKLQTV